jgi:hypothetical protein
VNTLASLIFKAFGTVFATQKNVAKIPQTLNLSTTEPLSRKTH